MDEVKDSASAEQISEAEDEEIDSQGSDGTEDEGDDQANQSEENDEGDDDDEEDGGEEEDENGEDNDDGSESGSEVEEEENPPSNDSDSDNSERDKCCICLHKLKDQEIGVPTVCEHRFCCECITEWHKNSQTCPIDRQTFDSISVLRDDGTFLRFEDLRGPEDAYLELPPLPDDITQCEVCGLGDREDRLLLCDECNFGYHLECLNPPLQTVPLDDWFCPSCTEDRIVHPRRLIRVPPQIILPPAEPDSIQRSLLTRRIRQRRQKSRRRTVKRKTMKRKRKTTSKGKAKKPRAKARTTKGKAGTRRRKGRKVRRKGKRKVRAAVQEKPTTTRDRLASQLGIVPPKPGQIYLGMPTCKSANQPSTSSAALHSLSHHKLKAGISTLRLYSHYEDLADCLENESDDEELLGEGSVGVICPARHRVSRVPSKMGMTGSGIGILNQTSSPDILSQIMSSQQTLLMDRNIRIGRDGVLIPSIDPSVQRGNSSPNKMTSITKTGGGAVQESPNGRIRQAPLNNTEQSSNSSQNSRYNNDNSAHLVRNADSNSRTESETLISSVSNSHGSENNEEGNESTGHGPNNFNNQCDQSPQKSKMNKSRSEENNKPSNDDDEDFNIYSDIQENNVSAAIDPVATFSNQAELYSGEIQNESDNEMIIDEAATRRTSSDDKPANQVNQDNNVNADDFVRFPPTSDSDNSPSPGMPEADSPESIPLPDSTPPPSVPMPDEPEADEVNEIQGGSVLYSPSDDEESGRQVYDPSQPLTSSDEEEHNDRQKQPAKPSSASKEAANRNSQASSDKTVDVPKADAGSIPAAAPSDEQRRPTIQFSIPTRHKLIPISSLIKRQRGVMRKESGGPGNQVDASRLFAESSQNDTTDGDTASADRPSLVAEIFGSDDEEESKETPAEEAAAPETTPDEVIETNASDQTSAIVESMQSNKWKRVDETPAPASLAQGTSRSGVISAVANEDGRAGVTEPDLESATHDMNSTETNNDEAKKTAALEIVSEGSDDDIKIISATRKEPDIIFLSSEKSSSNNSKDSSGKEGTREKKKDSDKRSRKEKDERHRSQKRKRSSSMSNYEEGEIPALDKKKKKVKKNKKVKKRKRSKDSTSPPRLTSTDKQPDVDQNFNSSSDAEEGRNVSWRKPSKSTKERNYRDGKPKTDEKYFREKDTMEGSSHDRKDAPEKSPHYRSKDRRGSKSEGKKSHRRSTSRDKVSPIRWSRSPSPSRNRTRGRRERNRSRSLSSRESFSPRRSIHSRGRHLGHPLSLRNERSGSRSPRLRSKSPTSDKHRRRRRSRSRHRSRSNHRRGGRSSSGSRSRSRSRTKKRHDKLESGEKSKKGSSKKDKEKVETVDALPPEEETKDKEKKKKRKRKEKSISPAKAVFADGDSIVISLNFQKPKDVPKESTESTETAANEEPTEKKKKRGPGRDGSSTSKSKPLKKTVLIDLETSPIQEQKIGESPTIVVLSDDEDEHNKSKHSRRGKDSHHNEKEQEGVTTSGGGEDSSSPNFPNGKGVQADSTQVNQTETQKSKDFMFGHDGNTSSPARGDSIVTSTRDSIEGAAQTEEDSGSRSNSPTPPEPQSVKHDSPKVKTPPVAESPIGRQVDGSRTDSFRSTPTSTAPLALTTTSSSVTMPSVSNSTPGLVRPLGIGNIPGLFPSSALSGIPIPPTPVVIPTPPQPQLRFATNAINPSINILASVANALYGPLMAARQAQPNLSKPPLTSNNVGQRVSNQPNTLLPKSQNSHSHGRRSGDGGDSPFSPNSSDGDDLFEPPLEKRMPHNLKDSLPGPSGNSIGHKPDKTDRSTAPNPPAIGGAASALNAKSKSALFDSLFGSPSKKTPTQSSSVHSKTHVKAKSKSHEPSKSKVHKPEVHKQLTEGELRETGEVPSSAVELRVKEKYLKKLNRQERVVEEVKLALKPHYGKKIINKDDYKEILRRAVPKICHTKSGEINPFKIKELVEAYVKKFRHSKGK